MSHVKKGLFRPSQLWNAEPDAILSPDIEGKHPGISLGRFQSAVSGIGLHNFKRDGTLDQVHTETVAKGM